MAASHLTDSDVRKAYIAIAQNAGEYACLKTCLLSENAKIRGRNEPKFTYLYLLPSDQEIKDKIKIEGTPEGIKSFIEYFRTEAIVNAEVKLDKLQEAAFDKTGFKPGYNYDKLKAEIATFAEEQLNTVLKEKKYTWGDSKKVVTVDAKIVGDVIAQNIVAEVLNGRTRNGWFPAGSKDVPPTLINPATVSTTAKAGASLDINPELQRLIEKLNEAMQTIGGKPIDPSIQRINDKVADLQKKKVAEIA